MQEVGQTWLDDYMAAVWAALQPLGDALNDQTVSEALTAQHDVLADAWIGTTQQPGALARLMLAGMAAGNEVLSRPTDMQPQKSGVQPIKAVDLTIDWSLLSSQALAFVRRYTFDLIRRIDDTTRQAVSDALAAWIAQGAPLSDLTDTLAGVFQDPARAEVIASTESARAYFEGAQERYRQAGITQMQWRTVNVGLDHEIKEPGDVCAICSELHMKIGDLEHGWWSERLGTYTKIPAHVRCRCWATPILSE